MKTLSKVNCQYGAPMGRYASPPQDLGKAKMRLVQVKIDRGGYDSGGAYWGLGSTLYWATGENETEQVETFVRAANRAKAKAKVRTYFGEKVRF